MQVILAEPPDSAASQRAVLRLRARLDRQAARSYVGGVTAGVIDLTRRVSDRSPVAILVTVALGLLVLVTGLRALVVPVKAVLSTLLSVAATIGILLRIEHTHRLEFFVPLFLFAILFGLSVDYEIFLLSRIREAVLAGHPNREAVRRGLIGSARSISLAGLALIVVFAAFATSSLAPFRQLGIGLTIAVALDVTLVRCVLVPATVVLLGRWNWWWPGRSGMPARASTPLDRSRD
jgi:RND superfamily putative drug exporter